MKDLGILVGASPIGGEREELLNLIKQERAYVIAVDGGIKFFIDEKIEPDYWMGDMDSAAEYGIDSEHPLFEKLQTKIVSAIKDDTDMDMAVKYAKEQGCMDVIIYGGLGGRRVSHTIANVQLLHRMARLGIRVTMASEGTKLFVLNDGHVILPARDNGFVSIMSLSDKAKKVCIRGLFYEFEGDLENDFALGVSNHFIGREAYISVKHGALLIVLED